MTNSNYLRDLTAQTHMAAKNTALAQAMINGTLTETQYHDLLFNMLAIFQTIENRLDAIPASIKRVDKYRADLATVTQKYSSLAVSTIQYINYLDKLNSTQVWAHAYVLYLGLMYGSQILSEVTPWLHTHLDFDNVKQSIAYIRANSTETESEESNIAFQWIAKIYDELYNSVRADSVPA